LYEELDKAEQDKEGLKTIYNNYFLQIQSLINQKAIEEPGNKKSKYKMRSAYVTYSVSSVVTETDFHSVTKTGSVAKISAWKVHSYRSRD
jgi:hypothetical protein